MFLRRYFSQIIYFHLPLFFAEYLIVTILAYIVPIFGDKVLKSILLV